MPLEDSNMGFFLNALLQIARKINNVEVSWALGAALHMLDDIV